MAHKLTTLQMEKTCWTSIIALLSLTDTQIRIPVSQYRFFTIILLFYEYTGNIEIKRVQPKRSFVKGASITSNVCEHGPSSRISEAEKEILDVRTYR